MSLTKDWAGTTLVWLRSFSRIRDLPAAYLVPASFILVCLLVRILDPPAFASLRLIAFDTWQRAAPRAADPTFPVKVVAIDEQSLKRFGQWPWDRRVVAELVDRLRAAGVRSIAIDLVFAEADRFAAPASGQPGPTGDAQLAAALRNAPSVLAVVGDARGSYSVPPPKAAFAAGGSNPISSVHRFPAAVLPLPTLTDAAAGLGAVNWFPERDQIVRRVPVLVGIANRVYPSLTLEALRISSGETTIFVQSASSGEGGQPGIAAVRIGQRVLPVDPNGELWLRFAPADPRRTVSAADVLAGLIDGKELTGRHVVIGATAIGLSDVRATALAPDVPGAEIHAQALEQMLSGESLTRPDYMVGLELALLVAGSLAIALLVMRLGAVTAALSAAAFAVAMIAGSWLAYRNLGLLVDPTFPVLTFALIYLGSSLTAYLQTERERNRIRLAFGHYLAPAMVEQLARQPDMLKLGGEMRDITVLFADVRNFTGLSETMTPSELVQFVNRVFTPLTDAILVNKGTIDKYMGDAVLAFWNAPLADLRHPENTCRAALKMREAMAELNRDVGANSSGSVRIGIGINTGSAVVGNVGSPQRFDYSVLGEVVNTASRLQDATKTCGADILLGEATAGALPHFAILEVAEMTLRGKSRPERIYALLGDEELKASPGFQRLAACHSELLTSMRVADRIAAGKALQACGDCRFPGTETLYLALGARLDGL